MSDDAIRKPGDQQANGPSEPGAERFAETPRGSWLRMRRIHIPQRPLGSPGSIVLSISENHGMGAPLWASERRPLMKNSKSNDKISVVTFSCFEASPYDLLAKVYYLQLLTNW